MRLSAAGVAGGKGKAAGGSLRGPLPRPRPRTETVPCRLTRQGAAPEPPGSPRRGGTFPTGSDPGQSRGTGAPQPVCQGNPSGCVLGGGGGGVRKKKRWLRPEWPPPPPDGPRPFPLREQRRWGGGETEEPAAGHGLGVTEPPGRPGGCGRRGRTTPAGAAAQRPARAAVTGAEPTGLGRLGGASRKRGPWAPLCEGRGEGCRANPGRGGPRCAAPTASLRGAARLPTPPLGACPPPHAPCLGFGSYRKGITIPSPPTRHLALSPPPPLTSSSSPVGPSAAPHSPPQFADFRPPSASPSRRG
ncbi:ras-related protein Rap-2c isoform X1 [Vulpes lagopus]|uniref:ras-related protein Rap-2c isoform X1 n=1 Tax=Vulpes lagopus TaxID=494514 RepID=UPI001BC8CC7C|nr:ras-related protein Rap-2c isoform X1 [Vulpes lagopus]